jgi:hypothetical protein
MTRKQGILFCLAISRTYQYSRSSNNRKCRIHEVRFRQFKKMNTFVSVNQNGKNIHLYDATFHLGFLKYVLAAVNGRSFHFCCPQAIYKQMSFLIPGLTVTSSCLTRVVVVLLEDSIQIQTLPGESNVIFCKCKTSLTV